MDWVHVHLILNHVPVVGTVIAALVLGAGMIGRNRDVVRVALWLLVLMAPTTAVVYLTGEPTEEAVEGLAGFSEAAMESHEEAALVATIIAAMAGLAALGGLFSVPRSDSFPGRVSLLVLLVALGSGGAMAYTANLGGEIRHSEIRAGDQARLPAAERGEERGEEKER
ncbi:MAG: hypothetical protein R3199_12015 [Gemmatimonadota bacterium]|nr:hypothetical protein [Gemmatimonadota bacterium]